MGKLRSQRLTSMNNWSQLEKGGGRLWTQAVWLQRTNSNLLTPASLIPMKPLRSQPRNQTDRDSKLCLLVRFKWVVTAGFPTPSDWTYSLKYFSLSGLEVLSVEMVPFMESQEKNSGDPHMGGWSVVVIYWDKNRRLPPGSQCLISSHPTVEEVQPYLPSSGPEIGSVSKNSVSHQGLVQLSLSPFS